MANTRADYWSVDAGSGAVSLHTYAIQLDPIPSGRIPGRKGTNPSPTGLDGDRHADKPWAPLSWQLLGWASDRDADGALAAAWDLRVAQLEANLDTIEAVLVGDGGQVTVTKRTLVAGGGTTTVSAFTRAVELVGFDVTYADADRRQAASARWAADLVSADPWWYDGATRDHLR